MRGVFVVRTRPTDWHDEDFNRWYDEVHVPEVLLVPGFVSARRFRSADGDYLAVYELEADDLDAVIADFRAQERTPPVGMQMDPPPEARLWVER
jgi:hypothetical protein